ncbi:MAG TPA: efflux RND transporter periplasmic adaptor subunit [Beggiatoa sp.]|nr:MAG: hypothetical protein B6247_03625 [Beggiatoa sp. 4572_84]RKZ60528.1 MAG: efflux RND transporter periplasmic adaptor subunit [Gammaproteobacteria bacterium]HEW98050.1 efflux RND transporter periplasmic adaptor subunit [Beggiatoa sp.]
MRTVIILLITALLLMACNQSDKPSESLADAMDDSALEHANKHLNHKYICPMHPQIVRDEPGRCPICGMFLVKKEVKQEPQEPEIKPKPQASKPEAKKPSAHNKHPTVTIRPEIIQKMGVRTITVNKGTLPKYIKTVGYVAYNEDKLVHIHPRSSGWVEKLYVRRQGDLVKRGQSLLAMYSPEVLEAQQDFLVALRTGAKGTRLNRRQYKEAIRNRLRLLGVPERTIKQIERNNRAINNVPIFTPQSGTVIHLNIREGMYVTPSLEMFTIVDLSRIWVMVEVFEHQLDWVSRGLKAEIKVPALPGRVWKGKVDYVYPELEPKTRTLKVRLRFDNPRGLLKLNMFAQVEIHGKPKKKVLKIPRQALIVTGERESVIVALGKGRFKPVDVKTGMRSQGEVEILSGLKKGNRIVLSGQFLIDSEANLQASFLRFSEAGQQSPQTHQH